MGNASVGRRPRGAAVANGYTAAEERRGGLRRSERRWAATPVKETDRSAAVGVGRAPNGTGRVWSPWAAVARWRSATPSPWPWRGCCCGGRRLGCRTPPWRPLLPTSSRPTAYGIFAGRQRRVRRGRGAGTRRQGVGLGTRSQRYAAILEDGVVRQLMVEPDPLAVTVSSVDTLLDALCPEPDPVLGSGYRAGSAAAGTGPNAPRWWCTRPRRGRRAHPRPRSRCAENPARHVVGGACYPAVDLVASTEKIAPTRRRRATKEVSVKAFGR
jgi:hypothetical protein